VLFTVIIDIDFLYGLSLGVSFLAGSLHRRTRTTVVDAVAVYDIGLHVKGRLKTQDRKQQEELTRVKRSFTGRISSLSPVIKV